MKTKNTPPGSESCICFGDEGCDIKHLNELIVRLLRKQSVSDHNSLVDTEDYISNTTLDQIESHNTITLLSSSSIFILSCAIVKILAFNTMIFRKLLII